MTFLMSILLATTLLSLSPSAAAHVCGNAEGPGGSASGSVNEDGSAEGRSGSGDWEADCGPCTDGEDHVHGSAQGDASGEGSATGCVSSKHFVPGAGIALAIAALVGASVVGAAFQRRV